MLASRVHVFGGALLLSRRRYRRISVLHEKSGESESKKSRLPHTPVLLNKVKEVFEGKSLRTFVDCTVGSGGHAFEIIRGHPEIETYVGFDVDPGALALARERLEPVAYKNRMELHFVHSNFRHVKEKLDEVDPELLKHGVDGILMDLGLSSMQVDSPERGFSYYLDGPLDMRMDPTDTYGVDAARILNDWPETEIGRTLREYGEELRWKYLARKIVGARLNGGVKTTHELVKLIAGRYTEGKYKRVKHPAARTFQALRIAVNDELGALKAAVSDSVTCLAPGGRLAVISFHSLEDRLVKYKFKELGLVFDKNDLAFKNITTKPIKPDMDEIESNSRCRSAKMRVIQRACPVK